MLDHEKQDFLFGDPAITVEQVHDMFEPSAAKRRKLNDGGVAVGLGNSATNGVSASA